MIAFIAIGIAVGGVVIKNEKEKPLFYADLSPDGKQLAVIWGGTLIVSNIGSGKELQVDDGVYTCRWGSDGTLWYDKVNIDEYAKNDILKTKTSIWKWDSESGAKLVVKDGSQPCPSPDGKLLAYRIEPQFFLLATLDFVNAIYYLEKGDIKGGIAIYDTLKKTTKIFEKDRLIANYGFSPDGHSVVGIFSIAVSELKEIRKKYKNKEISGDEENKELTSDWILNIDVPSSRVQMIDKAQLLSSVPLPFAGSDITGPYFLEDGSVIVGEYPKKTARIWRFKKENDSWTKTLLWSEENGSDLSGFAVSNDGQYLLLFYVKGEPVSIPSLILHLIPPKDKYKRIFRLVNLKTKQEIVLGELGNNESIRRLAYNPALGCFYIVTKKRILAVDRTGKQWNLWSP